MLAYWGAVCGLLALIAAPTDGESPEAGLPPRPTPPSPAHRLMRHRGPDEPGGLSDPDGDGAVVFGFNRLSIIDIAHSHQPLRWGPREAPDRYVLVFNGEIYNYLELREELRTQHGAVFATDGDGEAIVAGYHYWGTDVLNRLRGMFAFALWDTVTRELFCARDPFGIKPLFMATGDRRHRGGQREEVPAGPGRLIGFDTGIDERARAALHGPAVRAGARDAAPRRATARIGLLRQDPGRAWQPEITRYFVPRFAANPITPDTEQARYDEITAVLEDSVAKHMRADVTVGAFLSGGIDSTAIAALAIRHNPRLITFTTGFEREGFSEIDVAVASAEAIGAAPHRQGGQRRGVRRRPARDRLVPRRTGRRPGAGAAVLRRPRGPQARQGGAVRRGRRRAVRRLHDLPGAVVAEALRLPARGRCGARWARCPSRCPRACAARACCTAGR